MAYFAELDDQSIVTRVVAISSVDLLDENNQESEEIGRAFVCKVVGDGEWFRTWYSGARRKQFAGPGHFYDSVNDVFIAPQPFPSWVLNETFDWTAPIPMPEDDSMWWTWDEATQQWIGEKKPDPVQIVTLGE